MHVSSSSPLSTSLLTQSDQHASHQAQTKMSDNAVKLEFRVATVNDADKIQQLIQTAFQTNDSRQDWTGHVELASNFRLDVSQVEEKIADPNVTTLVAMNEENGDLVATIDVTKQEPAQGDDSIKNGRLSMIAVDDAYQRQGVGRKVLEYAEELAQRNWGANKFSLNALSTRPALIEWYMRRGYRKTGETTPFPREKFSELDLPEDMCLIEMDKVLPNNS